MKPDQPASAAPQSPLGQVQSSEGNVDIQTQRQVVITEKSEVPTVRTVEIKGDLKRMEEKRFQALGLSPDLSRDIVNYRRDHNGFKSVDELKQVQGMDDQNFNCLRGKLAASGTG
ncbi:MAG: helix-hairpin-helix domain-containing protein [Methylotenera sp.]|nr:helix-hairpin-helix domain-containing protein [Oligoflexia bacterium]